MKIRKLNPVDVFDIQNLPDVPFRRVLFFLTDRQTRNLRLLSKWFEKRITFLRRSLFNKFHIKGRNKMITESNCLDISRTLSIAMAKPHAPQKLELQNEGEINDIILHIIFAYKDNIISLDIDVKGNEDLLLQQSFTFECLESLSLDGYPCNYDTMVTASQAMLDKHASNLKKLKVKFLKKILKVPNLPKLDCLSLMFTDKETAWTLLDHCRPTITSLEIIATDMDSSSFRNSFSNNFVVIPNIQLLKIKNADNALNFATLNAEHLVALELTSIRDLPENLVWPQFPKLRELIIDDSRLLPILVNCRETQELLVSDRISYYNDEYSNVVLLRLTDLYLIGVNLLLSNKIICCNHKSLAFLFVKYRAVSNLDNAIRMEGVRNVILGFSFPYHTVQDKERMAMMCPNAEVDILSNKNEDEIKDLVNSRGKKRNFPKDLTVFCYQY